MALALRTISYPGAMRRIAQAEAEKAERSGTDLSDIGRNGVADYFEID